MVVLSLKRLVEAEEVVEQDLNEGCGDKDEVYC